MRILVRTTVTAALLAAALAATSAAATPAYREHTAIPVGAVTDLGDLTTLARLGYDFAGLLGG
ncbi:hypothetical protein OG871_03750 [Kitasatospora sp. NBC_00374]|uniref:hypothetical protein n=1 Tax=Kitasatospora sp. NBC_00374 TaxID=2975964 RepID=UPI0030E50779